MAKLTLFTAKLEANADERTLKGRLLPFDEPGFTNLGKLTASKDSQLDVADEVILNVQHDNTRPVGKAVALETNDGIDSVFRVFATQAGNDALLEASEGVRAGLSIELEPVVIRNGHIVSGTITGAALVTKPAFESARLAAAEEGDVPDMGDEDNVAEELPKVVINNDELENVTAVEVTESKITISTEEERKDEEVTATVTNPALTAGFVKTEMTKNKLYAQLAEYGTTRMEAALSDIVPANTPGVGINQPQYVGELWSGVEYERLFINNFNHGELTSYNQKGWKWNNKPAVAKYTGNKTDVPSNAISMQEVNGTIQRFAGAHDVDRVYTDFGDAEFWDAYFKAMAESYSKETDLYIRDIVREIPTAGNGQRVHLLTGNAPAGVPTALWQIVEGCAKIINDLGTVPTHAYVTVDAWKPILYTPVNAVLEYLNANLGLRGGTLEGQGEGFKIIPVPVGSLTATGGGGFTGKVLVAHKNALTVRELGGGAPIRVNALDVAKGGVDEGLFGYVGTMVEEPKGIVLFDTPAAS